MSLSGETSEALCALIQTDKTRVSPISQAPGAYAVSGSVIAGLTAEGVSLESETIKGILWCLFSTNHCPVYLQCICSVCV